MPLAALFPHTGTELLREVLEAADGICTLAVWELNSNYHNMEIEYIIYFLDYGNLN